MITRRHVLRRLETIRSSSVDIASKSQRLKELESVVNDELKGLETGFLSVGEALNPRARAKMLVRLDRLRACVGEINAALDELYRPVEMKLHPKTTAQ